MQYVRALKLIKRVLKLKPGHRIALAILCSSLRRIGEPEKALKQTNKFRRIRYTPLLTSRAAAFCDLNRWEEAKKQIGYALAIDKNAIKQGGVLGVINRIKKARPDLY